jgi:hypothetical protein
MGTSEIAARLRERVERASRRLRDVPEAEAARRPAPGKWSRKEILGHLLDSASNNHQRFVRARFQDDLVFAGYEQDDWVAAERWQERPWAETLEFWRLFNRHLAHLIESTPRELAERVHTRHNLHLRAWKPIEEGAPATLAWFMEDYLGHLEHHLAQAGG